MVAGTSSSLVQLRRSAACTTLRALAVARSSAPAASAIHRASHRPDPGYPHTVHVVLVWCRLNRLAHVVGGPGCRSRHMVLTGLTHVDVCTAPVDGPFCAAHRGVVNVDVGVVDWALEGAALSLPTPDAHLEVTEHRGRAHRPRHRGAPEVEQL